MKQPFNFLNFLKQSQSEFFTRIILKAIGWLAVGNSEIKNIKRQLKKQGYSDVVIEEILKWFLGKKRNNKAFKNAESTTKMG